jgi:ankyrin repeat protein
MMYSNIQNESNSDKDLIKACKDGDTKWIQDYIKQVVNFYNIHDYALYISSLNGHSDIVKLLIENIGADIHVRNDAVLKFYAKRGDLTMIKWLDEHCADIHVDNNYVLRISAQNGYLKIVEYLVESGAIINSNNGIALRSAIEHGHLDVVRYLVSHGANINASNDDAIYLAKKHKHLDIANYLIKYGNDNSTIRDDLHKIVKKYSPDIKRYFINNGIIKR